MTKINRIVSKLVCKGHSFMAACRFPGLGFLFSGKLQHPNATVDAPSPPSVIGCQPWCQPGACKTSCSCRDIVNIDFCKPVIEAMQKAHADKPGMEWKVRLFWFESRVCSSFSLGTDVDRRYVEVDVPPLFQKMNFQPHAPHDTAAESMCSMVPTYEMNISIFVVCISP